MNGTSPVGPGLTRMSSQCIAIDRGRHKLAAGHLEHGQLDEVEWVVAGRAGLDPDELAGHRDRPIEVVGRAGKPERDAIGAVVLPGPPGWIDQLEAARDLVA